MVPRLRLARSGTSSPLRARGLFRAALALGIAAVGAVADAGFAQGGPPASPVVVDRVRIDEVQERRRVSGELRPARRSRIATREPGIVIDLPVVEGQRVLAGETLCRLDGARLEIAVRELAAEIELARSAEVERTAELGRIRRDADAIAAAAERGAANPKELADARSAVDAAEARLEQSRRSILVNQARLDLWKRRIADTTIVAPFDGVVASRSTELGEWVAEGSPILELVSTGALEAWIDVPQEIGIKLLGIGGSPGSARQSPAGSPAGSSAGSSAGSTESPASTSPDAPTAAPLALTARVDATGEAISLSSLRIVPVLDPRARSYPVIATIDDHGILAPGMSISAWIPTGESAERLTVHRDAVLRGPTGTFVYVVRGPASPTDGGASGAPGGAPPGGPSAAPAAVALPASVEPLFDIGDRVVVSTRELRAGDRVVIEGNERLYPGAPVSPMEAARTAAVR